MREEQRFKDEKTFRDEKPFRDEKRQDKNQPPLKKKREDYYQQSRYDSGRGKSAPRGREYVRGRGRSMGRGTARGSFSGPRGKPGPSERSGGVREFRNFDRSKSAGQRPDHKNNRPIGHWSEDFDDAEDKMKPKHDRHERETDESEENGSSELSDERASETPDNFKPKPRESKDRHDKMDNKPSFSWETRLKQNMEKAEKEKMQRNEGMEPKGRDHDRYDDREDRGFGGRNSGGFVPRGEPSRRGRGNLTVRMIFASVKWWYYKVVHLCKL